MVGILALLVALVLYSLGVWGAFRAKEVRVRDLVLIWVGFVFDVLATTMMALQIGGIAQDLHTVLAFIGMIGMLLGAVVGTWAHAAGNDSVKAAVARWIVAPWVVWVAVFVWGMVERGAARMVR
jgi:uncharacterized repeat protein (TIGR03987 family)